MDLKTWLSKRSSELQIALTQEAQEQGLINPGRKVFCRLTYSEGRQRKKKCKRTGVGRHSEPVWGISLTGKLDEKQRLSVLSVKLKPQLSAAVEALLCENPKSDNYVPPGAPSYGWWSETMQSQINWVFREARLPWRVIVTGTPSDRQVHLGTVDASPYPRIGSVSYK